MENECYPQTQTALTNTTDLHTNTHYYIHSMCIEMSHFVGIIVLKV